jgi:hypothetical protein
MHRRTAIATVALCAVGTGPAAAQSSGQSLEEMFQRMLQVIAEDKDNTPKFAVDGKSVLLGEHRVTIKPLIEGTERSGGNFAAGVGFDVSIDGVPQPFLGLGTVGIAASVEEARLRAMLDWYAIHGKALFAAILRQPAEFMLGRFSVYSGLAALRFVTPAELPPGGLPTLQQMLSAIALHLPQLDGTIHNVEILVVSGDDGKIDGQVKIDAKISAPALVRLLRLPWPKQNKPPMFFKQACYLV